MTNEERRGGSGVEGARGQGPTGLAGRRRRLSDAETARRMLQCALDMVNSSGLTVSLEHIRLEDVIRDAGVSRSAVYRRWPYKDMFFSDLLRELAKAAAPAAVSDRETVERVRGRALERLDWFRTPASRHELLVELLRHGAEQDFEAMRRSTEWRTYLALHATYLSLDDGELRGDLQRTLAESERAFVTRIAGAYARLALLVGHRLRPGAGTFESLALLVNATMRGLVLTALSLPSGTGAAGGPGTLPGPGAGPAGPGADFAGAGGGPAGEGGGPLGPGDLSPLSAVGVIGIALAFLEPDPEVVWDDERVERVRGVLETGTGFDRLASGEGTGSGAGVE
ncbi:TetR/AcrR family transcriptional regulator [Streptomyces sp. NPDC014734]|uniref:TetR/AcrR family transcriptional regulator n=1 Tax=Streptomyces sp. NPDC014734 TaxID=3364886 RepID=UPI0037001F02